MRETPEWIHFFRRYSERQVKIKAGQMDWLGKRWERVYSVVFFLYYSFLINEINVLCDYM